MSILRSQLGRSPAIVQYNGATLFTRQSFYYSSVYTNANCTNTTRAWLKLIY